MGGYLLVTPEGVWHFEWAAELCQFEDDLGHLGAMIDLGGWSLALAMGHLQ